MSAYMQIYRVIPNSCESKGEYFSITYLKMCWGKYSRRAVRNILKITKDVNGERPTTAIHNGEACIRAQKVRGAYRQGFFFKNRWLFGKTTIRVITNPDTVYCELRKIMDLNERRREYERGLEAYRFMASKFQELCNKKGEKYFMLISF